MSTTLVDHPTTSESRAYSPSSSVHIVETLGKGGAAVLIAATCFCVVLASISIAIASRAVSIAERAEDRASIAEREARVATQDAIYMQAAVQAAGIQIPHPPGNGPNHK